MKIEEIKKSKEEEIQHTTMADKKGKAQEAAKINKKMREKSTS